MTPTLFQAAGGGGGDPTLYCTRRAHVLVVRLGTSRHATPAAPHMPFRTGVLTDGTTVFYRVNRTGTEKQADEQTHRQTSKHTSE